MLPACVCRSPPARVSSGRRPKMAIAIGLSQIYSSSMPIQKARVLERHSLLKTNPFPAILSFSALEHVIAQPRSSFLRTTIQPSWAIIILISSRIVWGFCLRRHPFHFHVVTSCVLLHSIYRMSIGTNIRSILISWQHGADVDPLCWTSSNMQVVRMLDIASMG